MKPVKIGLIGSGIISYTYLDNLVRRFDSVEVVGCSDLIDERSAKRAEEFGIRKMSNDEIFGSDEIEMVLDTTYWSSHTLINRQGLEAGKHIYTEKSLGNGYLEAAETVKLAKEKGLYLGCAPDTFLGAGYQTCRKLIEEGVIGEPVSATSFLARDIWPEGKEGEPRFLAGGTMPYDMSIYYTNALVHLFGPIRRVGGFAPHYAYRHKHPDHPRYGKAMEVETPTSMYGALEFHSGVYAVFSLLGQSFMETPRIEVYGTHGTLICPDPNTFGGPIYLKRRGYQEFMEIPLLFDNVTTNKGYSTGPWSESRRGLGVADMARAIREGRRHRCNADLHLHAMELIYGLEQCSTKQVIYEMTTKPEQPAPLKPNCMGRVHEAAF